MTVMTDDSLFFACILCCLLVKFYNYLIYIIIIYIYNYNIGSFQSGRLVNDIGVNKTVICHNCHRLDSSDNFLLARLI